MKTSNHAVGGKFAEGFFFSTICQLRIACLGILLLLSSLSTHAVGWQSAPALKFEKGPLSDISAAVGEMIRLQWDGNQIELNRDWPEVDEKEQLELRIQAFVDRGLDPKMAARFANRRGAGMGQDHPLDYQFNELATRVGASTSGGGGNGHRRYRFSNERIGGNFQRDNEAIELDFRDLTGSGQRIIFSDRDGQTLSLCYLSERIIVDFRQSETGQIRLSVIEEEPHLFVADDYRSLVNGQPEVVTKVLQPLFSHIGIVAPYMEFSPEIRNAMMTQLVAMADSDHLRVAKLIETLDSTKDVTERKDVLRQLADGLDHWQSSITRFSTEETLSERSKKALDQLLTLSNRQGPRKFVNENELMSKPEIFVSMLNERDTEEKKLILDYLKSLTQQDFGDDVQAWYEWLSQQ